MKKICLVFLIVYGFTNSCVSQSNNTFLKLEEDFDIMLSKYIEYEYGLMNDDQQKLFFIVSEKEFNKNKPSYTLNLYADFKQESLVELENLLFMYFEDNLIVLDNSCINVKKIIRNNLDTLSRIKINRVKSDYIDYSNVSYSDSYLGVIIEYTEGRIIATTGDGRPVFMLINN